jgi:hypothetical protein
MHALCKHVATAWEAGSRQLAYELGGGSTSAACSQARVVASSPFLCLGLTGRALLSPAGFCFLLYLCCTSSLWSQGFVFSPKHKANSHARREPAGAAAAMPATRAPAAGGGDEEY